MVSTIFFYFQVLQSMYQYFGDRTKSTNYNWQNITFMFHSFFCSLVRSRCLFYFSLSFNFILWSTGTAKFTILKVLFFLLIIIRSGHLAEIKWSVCCSKSLRGLCVLFSRTDVGIAYLIVKSHSSFLYNSQMITLPTQSGLVLYSFWSNLLHSLIMWLMLSSLSPYDLHLQFYYVLPILALIWSVLIALFCAALWKDSVSFSGFYYYCYYYYYWFPRCIFFTPASPGCLSMVSE